MDTISLEAFKAKKVKPTLAGLADTKNTGKDCSLMLGITNPYAFDLTEFCKYNITKLKGYARFVEVVLNREGESNGTLPVYFDGAVNYFSPLPAFDNVSQLETLYDTIQRNQQSASK